MRIYSFLLSFVLIMSACCGIAQDALLKNMDFKDGLKYWINDSKLSLPVSEVGFTVETVDGKPCLAAVGSGKSSFTLHQMIALPPPAILGKKVVFSAEIKPEKISGTFLLMVRESNHKGTIRYRKITLNKWSPNEWKKYTAEFVVGPPTQVLQVYIQSNFLAPGDKIFMKNLSVKMVDREK